MPFAEREPFVHSGVQSDDLAWNKAGTSFGTKLWQRSHVVGWRSTSSNTRRRLAPTCEWVLKRNGDLSLTMRRCPSLGLTIGHCSGLLLALLFGVSHRLPE